MGSSLAELLSTGSSANYSLSLPPLYMKSQTKVSLGDTAKSFRETVPTSCKEGLQGRRISLFLVLLLALKCKALLPEESRGLTAL